MPRHPVLNRRNVSPLVRKFVSVTEEGYAQATELAADLQVSTGSIVDTALRHLAGTNPDQVLELLRAHGHLTEAEYAYIESRRGAPRSRRPPAGRTAAGRGGAMSAAGTSKAKAPKKAATQARRQS